MYLETLTLILTRKLEYPAVLYGYALRLIAHPFYAWWCKIKTLNDEPDALRANMATVLRYYDEFENPVVRSRLEIF